MPPIPDGLPAAYPSPFEAEVVLADGGTVLVRPIGPADGPALLRFHSRLSPQSIYLRYFSHRPHLSEADVRHLTEVDYRWRMAFVAVLGDELVAVARYEGVEGSARAEVAFLVEDACQGRGIGTVLLEWLAAAARQAGIEEFYATTLHENRRMISVFRETGFDTKISSNGGEVIVRFPVAATDALARAIAHREHQAEARSVARLLAPRSIAVIGAGQRRGTIGHELFRNLLLGGFEGPVYPVNPKAAYVGAVRAYPTVSDIPDDVDLAVVCVPAAAVGTVVLQCAEKNVGGLVVVTGGFAETGPAGAEAERELVHLARRHGMRVVGPNSAGVVNTSLRTSMVATYAGVSPAAGRVALCSQSGALGLAALRLSARLGLGISTFVSTGNKADVSGNDLLQYWEDDAETDVILLYLESFGNPGKFKRIARRVSGRKPIVAVKSGRSPAASRGAPWRAGPAPSRDMVVDALFRQTGVIRVDTLEQLLDTAAVLAHQPLPPGRRVAVVGNTGGPCVLAADACEAAGLEVPELSAATQEALLALWPAAGGVRNPVDLTAAAGAATYQQVLRALLSSADVDAVVVVYTPTLSTTLEDVAPAIAAAGAGPWGKPLVANLIGAEEVPSALRGGDGLRPVPSFSFPETAAHALAGAAWYAGWRARPPGDEEHLEGIDLRSARRTVSEAMAAAPEGGWLPADQAAELLGAFGIRTSSGSEAGPDTPGPETTAGLARDPSFGPLVVLGDHALGVAPLTPADAADLVASTFADSTLAGSPPGLEHLLLRLSALGEQVPEVAEVALSPVVLGTGGAWSMRWRARLAPVAPAPGQDLRRLR